MRSVDNLSAEMLQREPVSFSNAAILFKMFNACLGIRN